MWEYGIRRVFGYDSVIGGLIDIIRCVFVSRHMCVIFTFLGHKSLGTLCMYARSSVFGPALRRPSDRINRITHR